MGPSSVPRAAALDPSWRSDRGTTGALAPGEVRLTFLGHSTVLIEVDRLRILTDPVLGAGLGPVRRHSDPVSPALFDDLDAIFISHGHHDHLDLASLRRVPGRPTILVPRGFGTLVSRSVDGPVEEVEPGEHLVIDQVPARRRPCRARRPSPAVRTAWAGAGMRGPWVRTVYFRGDTDLFAGMDEIVGAGDVALLPVWGWGPEHRARSQWDPDPCRGGGIRSQADGWPCPSTGARSTRSGYGACVRDRLADPATSSRRPWPAARPGSASGSSRRASPSRSRADVAASSPGDGRAPPSPARLRGSGGGGRQANAT